MRSYTIWPWSPVWTYLSHLLFFMILHQPYQPLGCSGNAKNSLASGLLHLLFPLPGALFLQISTWLLPSLASSLCSSVTLLEIIPWPLRMHARTHTHIHRQSNSPHSINQPWTYNTFTFLSVSFLSLPPEKKGSTWSGTYSVLLTALYPAHETEWHKVDVQLTCI